MFVRLLLLLFIVKLSSGEHLEDSKRIIFPQIINNVEHTENEACKMESEIYKEQLENLTLWAHEMWDATAKYTTGVLRGNVFQMGDWDECITIKAPYKTQYCLATIIVDVPEPDPPRDPISLHYSPFETVLNRIYKTEEISLQSRHAIQLGICTSAACSPSDLETFLNEYVQRAENPLEGENVTYSAKVSPQLCQTDEDRRKYDMWDMSFCLLVLVIVVLALSSTMFDYCQTEEATSDKKHPKDSLSKKMCLAFSIRRNFLDLPKADESNTKLRILYGMKTFSIFMIIMDHRFGTFLSGPIINTDYIETEYRSDYAAFIFHGDLFVDSFFVLSGLLVTYCLLVQFDKKVLNPLFIVFMRYLRLTPVYAFVIFYWASVFNHIGSGPLWKLIVTPEVTDCKENWWLNLLYLNNYVNDKHMCMIHSWYLPCDFHYFIVGIAIAMLLNKHRRYGIGLLVFLLLLSIIIPFVLTVVYLRPAMVQFYPVTLRAPKSNPDFRLTYTKSHTRAVSYIIGMFAGYIYYRLKDTTTRLSKISSHALTLASFILLFATVVTGTIFYDRYHEYNAIESGAYAALHRVAWCAGTVGLLFSASYGHAGLLRSVLSWSPWIPLGKLVYGAYLIHMSFQLRSVAMTITPKYFTYFDVISMAFSDIILAFAAALFLYLGIEAPLRKIFKELLAPSPRPSKKAAQTESNGGQNVINNNTQHNNQDNNSSRL